MKKILALLLTLSSVLVASAQVTTKVQTDSLLVYQVKSFPAELILKNRTSNRAGAFLRNRYDGRTEFAYALDSAWLRDGNLVFRRGTDSLTFLLNNLTQVNAGSGIRKTGSVFHLGNELTEDASIWGRNWSTYFGDPTRRISTFNVYARSGVSIYDSTANGYAPSLQMANGSATLQGRNATLYGANNTTFQAGNFAYLTAPNMLMEGTTSFVFGGIAQQQTADSSTWKPVVMDGSGNIRKGWWHGGGAGGSQTLNQVLTNGNQSDLSAYVREVYVGAINGGGGQSRLRLHSTGAGQFRLHALNWNPGTFSYSSPGALDLQGEQITINQTQIVADNTNGVKIRPYTSSEAGNIYVTKSDGFLDTLKAGPAGAVLSSNGPNTKPSWKPGGVTTFQGALTNGAAITAHNDVTGSFRMGFGTSGSRISAFNAYASGNININASGTNTIQAGSLNYISAPTTIVEGTNEVTLAGKPLTMVADTNSYKLVVRDASGNLRSAPWLGPGGVGGGPGDTLVVDSRPGLTFRGATSASLPDTLTMAKASKDSSGFISKSDYRLKISRVFYPEDYGAIPGDTLSDQTAIQTAINTAFAAGGGTVKFNRGKYLLKDSVIQYAPSGIYVNAHLYIPRSLHGDSSINITLEGEGEPSWEHSVLVDWPINQGGTILESTIFASTPGRPAIIGTEEGPTPFSSWNMTSATIRNLTLRSRTINAAGTATVNKMTGINFATQSLCTIENVRVDITSKLVASPFPGFTGSTGIFLPQRGNAAWVYLNKVFVGGYETGIVFNEHTTADNVTIAGCWYGIRTGPGDHSSHFNRILFNGVATNVFIEGKADFRIDNMATEHFYNGGAFGTQWYAFTEDVKVTADTPHVDITYHVVKSSVGRLASDFKVVAAGGVIDSVYARPIGQRPSGGGSSYTLPTASASTLGGVKVGSGLSIDGSGVLSATGGGGTPGGSNHQIQYNSSGSFAGSPNFTYNGTDLAFKSSSFGATFHLQHASSATPWKIRAGQANAEDLSFRHGETEWLYVTSDNNIDFPLLANSTSPQMLFINAFGRLSATNLPVTNAGNQYVMLGNGASQAVGNAGLRYDNFKLSIIPQTTGSGAILELKSAATSRAWQWVSYYSHPEDFTLLRGDGTVVGRYQDDGTLSLPQKYAGTGDRLATFNSSGDVVRSTIDPAAVSQAITQASAANTEAGKNFYQEVAFSGDGSTTVFNLTVSGTVTWATATASSAGAAIFPFYVTVGAGVVTFTFTGAPPTGTNNLKLMVHYRL